MTPAWPVVIKPTAANWHGSAYLCPTSLYAPNEKEIASVMNSFGHTRSVNLLKRAEEIAARYQINILGSTFLTLIELAGMSVDGDFHAQVTEERKNVIDILYPDLPSQPDARSSMIMANNLGRFAVFKITSPEATITRLRNSLTAFKLRYRQEAGRFLTTRERPIGDHLVHVPENDDEASEHIRALRTCTIGALQSKPPSHSQ